MPSPLWFSAANSCWKNRSMRCWIFIRINWIKPIILATPGPRYSSTTDPALRPVFWAPRSPACRNSGRSGSVWKNPFPWKICILSSIRTTPGGKGWKASPARRWSAGGIRFPWPTPTSAATSIYWPPFVPLRTFYMICMTPQARWKGWRVRSLGPGWNIITGCMKLLNRPAGGLPTGPASGRRAGPACISPISAI